MQAQVAPCVHKLCSRVSWERSPPLRSQKHLLCFLLVISLSTLIWLLSRRLNTIYDEVALLSWTLWKQNKSIYFFFFNFLFMRLHFIARDCSWVTWVMTSLRLLQIMLLWNILYRSFTTHMCIFLLGTNPGVKLLDLRICMWSVSVEVTSFLMLLYQFIL